MSCDRQADKVSKAACLSGVSKRYAKVMFYLGLGGAGLSYLAARVNRLHAESSPSGLLWHAAWRISTAAGLATAFSAWQDLQARQKPVTKFVFVDRKTGQELGWTCDRAQAAAMRAAYRRAGVPVAVMEIADRVDIDAIRKDMQGEG
jgi:hypothetical protein